jgi:hypothetical protein
MAVATTKKTAALTTVAAVIAQTRLGTTSVSQYLHRHNQR